MIRLIDLVEFWLCLYCLMFPDWVVVAVFNMVTVTVVSRCHGRFHASLCGILRD